MRKYKDAEFHNKYLGIPSTEKTIAHAAYREMKKLLEF